EREMAEVRELMREHRLVTLLAMGGVGKSRLSIQLGAEILDDFSDGVWLVELAPIAESADVPQAVATVLGVKEEPGGGVMESLARFVHERRLLLILDNCEHVVAGAASLAKRLLQSGPGITVLASSRDALQIAGECAYYLQTLAVPGTNLKAEELEEHASVRLFLDRALAVQPAFRLTDKVAAPVAEICRRLDGIPLALELAAARTRSLPVDVIAARLDQRFRLLATGDRTVLPRQRTLRALIDWSFDLLDERERSVFRRLSVFAGSLSLEAAEAVASADGMDAVDVTDLLGSLVEKSLVVIDVEAGRYRMLETVRHYADEKLVESGERHAVRARYLAFFADLAEQARPHLTGPEQAQWLGRLDTERDNILAAHDAGCSLLTDIPALVKIARGTRYYWFNRGQPSKGLQLYLDVLRLAGHAVGDADRCRLLFGAGQFEYYLGKLPEAHGHLAECLDIAERTGDDTALAAVLQPLGLVCLDSGDFSTARRHLSAALEHARAGDDLLEVVGALTALAMIDLVEGSFASAATGLEEALQISRTTGDDEATARCLINCAVADVRGGEVQRARERLRQAVNLATLLKSESLFQYVLDGCLALAAGKEDWAAATACYRVSERLLRRMGRQRERADASILKAAIDGVKSRAGAEPDEARGGVGLDDALAAVESALAF
ncbi:MAG: tetratricopeptide repeat protein, partial [Burkholderiaceae bacterium]